MYPVDATTGEVQLGAAESESAGLGQAYAG
jgi:hypothetical protein